MSEPAIDVLVVGAGPTGLSLAIDIARPRPDRRTCTRSARLASERRPAHACCGRGFRRPGRPHLSDRERSFTKSNGLAGDTLVLIRRDGYIGHIATADHLRSTPSAADSLTPPFAAPV